MQDLKDVTSHTHYENDRTGKLTEMMKNGEVTKKFSITLSNKEEGNALTAVGDEIRSRITASKKDGKGERPVENKKVKLELVLSSPNMLSIQGKRDTQVENKNVKLLWICF